MADLPTDWWQGKRGEWYVILQLALLAIVVLGPVTYGKGARWPDSIEPVLEAVGLVLVGVGFILGLAAVLELRRNLSPLPTPKPTATLVTSGPYRLVRHPIYGGLTLFALGWSLAFGGWISLASAAALLLVLERKAAREEQLLLERFPDYQAYRLRTRRFLPYLFILTMTVFAGGASPLLAHGPPSDAHVQGYILGPREGQSAMSHTIKADPALGSKRLGLGTQILKPGRGIEFHSHDIEDEVLYVVRGRGIGAVGKTRAPLVSGSLLYAPAGAWHAIKAEEEMEILWISSPPHFSRYLRELHEAQREGQLTDQRWETLARRHHFRDGRGFLKESLGGTQWQGDIEPWTTLRFDDSGLRASGGPGGQTAVEFHDPARTLWVSSAERSPAAKAPRRRWSSITIPALRKHSRSAGARSLSIPAGFEGSERLF